MDLIARDKIHDSISSMKNRSIIVIVTHSAETVKIADRIILLNEGNVQVEGTHSDLIESSSLYRRLFLTMEKKEAPSEEEGESIQEH